MRDGATTSVTGSAKRTFGYIDHFAFWRVVGWLKKRHLGLSMHTLVRRYLPDWEISDAEIHTAEGKLYLCSLPVFGQ